MSLTGKRILVTRSEDQAEELAAMIRGRGGIPVLFPTIRLVPPEDSRPLDDALARLSGFHWLLFASVNAARFFCARAAERGIAGPPKGMRVGCVGPGTEQELGRFGFPVHLTAKRHTAEGLVEALRREGVAGRRFLLPRAEEGRDVIPGEIRREGGIVETVVVYRNCLPERDEAAARGIVAAPPDVLTFASPSAFRNFILLLGERDASETLSRSRIAVIGEVTARAVEERKLPVDIMPENYTLLGMVEAIDRRLSSHEGNGGPKR
jgi:uroporphyrinogen-III synthase